MALVVVSSPSQGESLVTSLNLTNTIASARNGRVELFGQAFARGDVPTGQTLQAEVAGVSAPLQTMQTATWPDGSLQYGVFAVVAGDFTSSQTKTLELLTEGSAPSGSDITLSNLPTDGTSNADLTLGAETITCNRTNLLAAGGELVQKFTGPHCAHWVYRPTYSSPSRVYARFDVYAFREASSGAVDRVEYAGGNEVTQIRIDESDHGTVASSLNRFRVDGGTVLTETVELYQYTRWWEHNFDLDIHVVHDVSYMSSTGLIWSYLPGFNVTSNAVSSYASAYAANDGINQRGGWRDGFASGGTDPDIGPLPGQDVCYLIGQSSTMRDTMLRMHQRCGRHQMHMWDEDEGRPAQVGPGVGQHNTGDVNIVPFNTNNAGFWGSFPSASWSSTDCSHLPRFGYVPYLVSGRDWYLEETNFWAGMCCANAGGAYINSTDHNIFSADQIRAEGWATCTVATASAINPDGTEEKSYFQGAMGRNLSYTWDDNYAPDASPASLGWNMMGVVRTTTPSPRSFLGSPEYWIPWQQDFIQLGTVWAWKLGYDGTGSLADYSEYSEWLCRNTVGKINKFGWQCAALYWTELRPGTYDHQEWSELREDLFDYNEIVEDSGAFRPSTSFAPYDEATLKTAEPGSLAWRQAFNSTLGATSSIGYTTEPASDILIQWAAISSAVDRGAQGATQARSAYIQLTNKPDTETPFTEGQPQFEIVPTTGFPHKSEEIGGWIPANVPTDSTWQNVTSSLGRPLSVQDQVVSFAGGGCGGGYLYIFGGGHNNGMSDSTPVLDLRKADSIGWIEEVESTADALGVTDTDYAAIGGYLNGIYDGSDIVGGVRDSRGQVPLSRHTYDAFDVDENGTAYMYHGVLPYDNPSQPNQAWDETMQDLWRYRRGIGWEFLAENPTNSFLPTGSLCIDRLDSDRLWTRDGNGVRAFDLTNNTFGGVVTNGGNWGDESFMRFNEDDGTEGTLAVGGSFGGSTWNEYDITADSWSSNRAFPTGANTVVSPIFYVPGRYGSNYGAYFCFGSNQGTLWRWNGSSWASVATGGPSPNDYMYGRVGFDEVHQVFYAVAYVSGWQTWLVRPYAFE